MYVDELASGLFGSKWAFPSLPNPTEPLTKSFELSLRAKVLEFTEAMDTGSLNVAST
jgi:hypothetical protein